MNRRPAITDKSGAELQAEQEVLLKALRERKTQDVVYDSDGFSGQTRILVPTDDDPSPESVRLGEVLAVLADPNVDPPPSTLWEDNSPEGLQVKWLQAVDLALENHSITTKEWARLYAGFGRVGVVRGWHSEAQRKAFESIARRALGVRETASSPAPPPAEHKVAAPSSPPEPTSGAAPAWWLAKEAAWRAVCEQEGWGPRPRRSGLGLELS